MEFSFCSRLALNILILALFTNISPVSSSLDFKDALILLTKEISIIRDEIKPEPRPAHHIRKRDTSESIEVYSFKVRSDIKYRYSRTCITSSVLNRDRVASHEVTFQVVLPETAFISKFNMEIDGKVYEAYVKEKDEAKQVYVEAQRRGQSAGLVELNTRHSNVFNVNVNVKAKSKVNFNLTYEELLQRRLGRYEQSINISPDQMTNLEEVEILVNIEESQDITLVHVPNLRNEIEVEDNSKDKNTEAVIERPSSNRASVTWVPTTSDKDKLRKTGQIGKFVVQYDVKRELDAGEILIMNGYFVHFFAPANLKHLQKHIVFVLDISGSMMGRKIEQLKEAMKRILSDLNRDDFLNIIIFSSTVTHWAPGDYFLRKKPRYSFHHYEPEEDDSWKKQPFLATEGTILQAQNFIDSLPATDGTNIHDALNDAISLISNIKTTQKYYSGSFTNNEAHRLERYKEGQQSLPPNVESLIIFLTDGEPTVGVTNPSDILSQIRSANSRIVVPIFSLAFGTGADFTFLRRLSLQNFGFARKIYEAADAAIQLKGFYNEIASPLLANVRFNYTSPDYDVDEVTNVKFPTLFGGSELAVAGKMSPRGESADHKRSKRSHKISAESSLIRYIPDDDCHFPLDVHGICRDGPYTWRRPIVYSHWQWWCHPHPHPPYPVFRTTKRPVVVTQEDSFLERLWAYLTIQQLIDRDFSQEISSRDYKPSGESPRERALQLALKYGFVTSLTSLVVVKPSGHDDETGAFSADKDAKRSSPIAHSGSSGANTFKWMRGSSHHGKPSGATFMTAESDSAGALPEAEDSFGGSKHRKTVPTSRREQDDKSAKKDMDEEKPKKSSSAKEKKSEDGTPKSSDSTGYTLNDILWLSDYVITVKVDGVAGKYTVAQGDFGKSGDGTDVEHECTLAKKGRTGTCKHLKDCIQSQFLDNFQLYQKSYFCPIQDLKADHSFYAGVCCPSIS